MRKVSNNWKIQEKIKRGNENISVEWPSVVKKKRKAIEFIRNTEVLHRMDRYDHQYYQSWHIAVLLNPWAVAGSNVGVQQKGLRTAGISRPLIYTFLLQHLHDNDGIFRPVSRFWSKYSDIILQRGQLIWRRCPREAALTLSRLRQSVPGE